MTAPWDNSDFDQSDAMIPTGKGNSQARSVNAYSELLQMAVVSWGIGW